MISVRYRANARMPARRLPLAAAWPWLDANGHGQLRRFWALQFGGVKP